MSDQFGCDMGLIVLTLTSLMTTSVESLVVDVGAVSNSLHYLHSVQVQRFANILQGEKLR